MEKDFSSASVDNNVVDLAIAQRIRDDLPMTMYGKVPNMTPPAIGFECISVTPEGVTTWKYMGNKVLKSLQEDAQL